MFAGLFRLAMASALICAIGGHWAFLQSIAWTGMVISYAKHSPLRVAIEKTFDGKHPCTLCKVVAEGKKSEKQAEFQKVETKFDFFCCEQASVPSLRMAFELPRHRREFLREPTHAPPSPPPRQHGISG